jgi:hypothetical protein
VAALLSYLRTLLLALFVFPLAFATHEVMHLAVYTAFGVRAVLVVTQWHLGFVDWTIPGLHAAPADATITVPFRELVVNNFLGPEIAAVLLAVLWASVRGRSVARAALLANILVLLFFATIEVAYPLLDRYVSHGGADVLLLPELNYGVALAILLLVAITGIRGRPRTDEAGTPPTSRMTGRPYPPRGRLPV